ncbi:MAG TPA: LysM peptidoglycan-binding domain-containing protein [Thermoanaerobaculaceae bacterium]|nr:LysM peptidoglycan-binding domain-containing protein [Thermoanaerobaculaceae bacterium]HRS15746.1 LysM peptidoglycan-binding domain-containing protein [Thermoanaerobaculaceae bacterium]
MLRAVALPAALVLCLAACRSAQPPRVVPPPPGPVVVAEPDRTAELRDEIDGLLLAAREAQERGDLTEAEDCHTAAIERLLRARREAGDGDEIEDMLADLLEELEAYWDNGEGSPGEVEIPEPGPVPPEAVAAALDRARGEQFDLPVVINPEVTSLIGFYTGTYRERFTLALERAARYLPFIREELRRAGMPLDLAYLPMVESAFNPKARSRARAQGLWQFMAGTGKLYDLKVNGLVDERNDPYLATTAAVRHLGDLHAMFGDWELALAAYNSGAGRVTRALKRGKGSTDFWSLRRHLPRETRNYVPAMWAALVVAKNPEAYGFPRFEERPECLGRVPVEGALDLEVLAERVGVGVEQLAELNPALTHRLTPAEGRYQLAVPCGQEEAYAAAVAAIPPGERVRQFLHVVRKGDTPSAIARRYGSTVEAIVAANRLRNPRALRVGQTLVVPRAPGGVASPQRPAARANESGGPRGAKKPTPPSAGPAAGRYVVKPGDTLYDIARRHGTTVAELKRLNNLGTSLIKPGDVLVVAR